MQTLDLCARAEVSNRVANAAIAWLKLCRLHAWNDDIISRMRKRKLSINQPINQHTYSKICAKTTHKRWCPYPTDLGADA